MQASHHFRRQLALRLLGAAVVSSPLALGACGGSIAVEGSGASGGQGVGGLGVGGMGQGMPTSSVTTSAAGLTSGAGNYHDQWCFTWPAPPPTGPASSSAGQGGSATTSSVSTGSGLGGAGGSGPVAPCPAQADAAPYFSNSICGFAGVESEGIYKNGSCCYTVAIGGCSGRPFIDGQTSIVAPLAAVESDWALARADMPVLAGAPPRKAHLESETRQRLADAWAHDGLLEHASVASFGRFALELLAVGAPARLVEDAHRAAVDEVRHAQLCFRLASEYAGTKLSPGAFPFAGHVDVESDRASIAARAVVEGCVGETIAAIHAAEQLEAATDPAVRAVLDVIAEDEARHAELAWRTVTWAIRHGGDPVRAAVESAFLRAFSEDTEAANAKDHWDDDLAEHGRLSGEHLQAVTRRARIEVIGPAARALLAPSVRADTAQRVARATDAA